MKKSSKLVVNPEYFILVYIDFQMHVCKFIISCTLILRFVFLKYQPYVLPGDVYRRNIVRVAEAWLDLEARTAFYAKLGIAPGSVNFGSLTEQRATQVMRVEHITYEINVGSMGDMTGMHARARLVMRVEHITYDIYVGSMGDTAGMHARATLVMRVEHITYKIYVGRIRDMSGMHARATLVIRVGHITF